ncbi:MAG: hypothetical protein JWN51_1872 [Phycisphaerales bacterium]|nr:hypothetical protein [Phycisphaerales bacterium]
MPRATSNHCSESDQSVARLRPFIDKGGMSNTLISDMSQLPPVEYYKLVRSQIEHEDNLISQRLSWFLASHSFLFTAYAIVVSNLQSGHNAWATRQQHLLLAVIPVVSILTCVLVYATIVAAVIAIVHLRRLYNTHAEFAGTGLPPVQGYRRPQIYGQIGPLLLPLVFLAVWVGLIVQGAGQYP